MIVVSLHTYITITSNATISLVHTSGTVYNYLLDFPSAILLSSPMPKTPKPFLRPLFAALLEAITQNKRQRTFVQLQKIVNSKWVRTSGWHFQWPLYPFLLFLYLIPSAAAQKSEVKQTSKHKQASNTQTLTFFSSFTVKVPFPSSSIRRKAWFSSSTSTSLGSIVAVKQLTTYNQYKKQ